LVYSPSSGRIEITAGDESSLALLVTLLSRPPLSAVDKKEKKKLKSGSEDLAPPVTSSSSSSSEIVPNVYCEVIGDFVAESPSELNVTAGQIVLVVEEPIDGWVLVALCDQVTNEVLADTTEGYVPAAALRPRS
jgi:hypothetical protein